MLKGCYEKIRQFFAELFEKNDEVWFDILSDSIIDALEETYHDNND